MAIKDYSTTASSNSTLSGISVAEGMAPSLVNNVIRADMSAQKNNGVIKNGLYLETGTQLILILEQVQQLLLLVLMLRQVIT